MVYNICIIQVKCILDDCVCANHHSKVNFLQARLSYYLCTFPFNPSSRRIIEKYITRWCTQIYYSIGRMANCSVYLAVGCVSDSFSHLSAPPVLRRHDMRPAMGGIDFLNLPIPSETAIDRFSL